MSWRCTHCGDIYEDWQVCVAFEEGRRYEMEQRIEELERRVKHLEQENKGMRRRLFRYRKQLASLGRAISRRNRVVNYLFAYHPRVLAEVQAEFEKTLGNFARLW